MADIRVRLSVLWLFATLNYIYADVFFCIDVLAQVMEILVFSIFPREPG